MHDILKSDSISSLISTIELFEKDHPQEFQKLVLVPYGYQDEVFKSHEIVALTGYSDKEYIKPCCIDIGIAKYANIIESAHNAVYMNFARIEGNSFWMKIPTLRAYVSHLMMSAFYFTQSLRSEDINTGYLLDLELDCKNINNLIKTYDKKDRDLIDFYSVLDEIFDLYKKLKESIFKGRNDLAEMRTLLHERIKGSFPSVPMSDDLFTKISNVFNYFENTLDELDILCYDELEEDKENIHKDKITQEIFLKYAAKIFNLFKDISNRLK